PWAVAPGRADPPRNAQVCREAFGPARLRVNDPISPRLVLAPAACFRNGYRGRVAVVQVTPAVCPEWPAVAPPRCRGSLNVRGSLSVQGARVRPASAPAVSPAGRQRALARAAFLAPAIAPVRGVAALPAIAPERLIVRARAAPLWAIVRAKAAPSGAI